MKVKYIYTEYLNNPMLNSYMYVCFISTLFSVQVSVFVLLREINSFDPIFKKLGILKFKNNIFLQNYLFDYFHENLPKLHL